MKTQRTGGQVAGHASGDRPVETPVVEWLLVEPRRPVESSSRVRGHPWWLLVLATFVGGAGLGSLADGTSPMEAPARTIEAEAPVLGRAAVEATEPVRSRIEASGGRSIAIAIPADRAYVSSRNIVVAGMAFGRPHGSQTRSVHIEVFVGGTLIQSSDIDVFSSRFAGVMELPAPIDRTEAELRITDPRRPGEAASVRRFIIDAP